MANGRWSFNASIDYLVNYATHQTNRFDDIAVRMYASFSVNNQRLFCMNWRGSEIKIELGELSKDTHTHTTEYQCTSKQTNEPNLQ